MTNYCFNCKKFRKSILTPDSSLNQSVYFFPVDYICKFCKQLKTTLSKNKHVNPIFVAEEMGFQVGMEACD